MASCDDAPRCRLAAALSSLAVALALGVPAASSAAATSAALSPCRLDGVAHEARCGRVAVPLDPAAPQGRQIEVHYAVLPALARHKHPDPVFLLAGGPGQSAIDLAGHAARLLARAGQRRDIVLVDQRGTGRSAPLVCPELPAAAPLAESADPARQLARLARCRQSLQALPHGDLRHYATWVAVRDIDAVRRALGAARVNLVGGSYGTRVALEFLRQFPQAVRRVVLDGAAPPDMALPAAMSADAQAALDRVFDACAADAAGCARQFPTLRERWRALLAGLPRTVAVAHPLTGATEAIVLTRAALLGLVRAPLYVPALASGLPAALDAAARGRFEPLAALAGAIGPRRARRLAEGMHFAVVCAEDLPRLAAGAEHRGGDFGDAVEHLYRRACTDWPRAEVPEGFYTVETAPVAVLVLSGGADPATPARHGERVVAALGARARHVVVAEAGHGTLALPCLREAMRRFIDAEDDAAAIAVEPGCTPALPRPPAFVPVGLAADGGGDGR